MQIYVFYYFIIDQIYRMKYFEIIINREVCT